MVFGIQIKNGIVICPCCREMLWHCKRCWDTFHNGLKHNDYEPPRYYGQPMDEGADKTMKEKYGIDLHKTIIADKSRKYKEGEYH